MGKGIARAALVALALVAAPVWAQSAATATSVVGTVAVQTTDGTTRLLAAQSELNAGDLVTTQAESFARLRFSDGGELALRPNTQLRIDTYRFNPTTPQTDSIALSLLKGGLRSLTGLISRRSSKDAYLLRTPTATIGVRGTDYIARVCERDCAADLASADANRRTVAPLLVARVAALQGEASATPRGGQTRALALGAPVHLGDIVETAAASNVVLAFLDESRLSLTADTRFTVERYRFEPDRAGRSDVILRLLQGGLRAVTGLVAKARPQSYRVVTPTATIGVRGTGWDVVCTGKCADPGAAGASPEDDGLYLSTWEGVVSLTTAQGTLEVSEGQVAFVSPNGTLTLLPALPDFLRDIAAPRPDSIPFDPKLFGDLIDPNEEGLYVLVKGGAIILKQQNQEIVLEEGEAAFANPPRLVRLRYTPYFLERDRYLGLPLFDPQMCRPA